MSEAAPAAGLEPDRVVLPESVEEVQAVVLEAGEAGTRLLPAGRGTWLGAGGWGVDPGTRSEPGGGGEAGGRSESGGGTDSPRIVSTERLDAVHHYEPADLTLTAGAGIGLDHLARVLEPNGQWLPFDGPACDTGTLGAAVASGVSGPLSARYGAARDNVLGLEVVTGDGRILRIGGRVVKNVAGYDLVRLFTGSRGSLGVITRVSVRLFPRPDADVTLLFGGDAAGAVAAARRVCTHEVPVAAVEVIEGDEGGVGRAAAVAVRLLGGVDEVDESRARIVAAAGADPSAALEGGESRAFHERRIGWEAGAGVVARLAALPDRLAETLECARAVAAQTGGATSADAIQGVVRVKGSCGEGDLAALAEGLLRGRREMAAAGGTLTLSQAPAEVAARVGWTGGGGEEGGLTSRIKSLFDPDSTLAPSCP